MLLSLLSTILILLSFIGLGQFGGNKLRFEKLNVHQKLVAGLIIFQITSLFSSLVIPQQSAFYFQIAVGTLGLLPGIKSLKPISINLNALIPLLLLIILTPLFARLLSPPVSPDGLSFYLPNIEWVFNKGIAFNPYLTRYTTMPLGAERVFSFAFGINGFQAVRFLDASFAILLLTAMFKEVKRRMNIHFAVLTCLAILLIPGTFIWNFGTGKVDTLSTYVFIIGIFSIINEKKNKWLLGIILLSSLFNVKLTNWILLSLPVAYACLMYLVHSDQRYKALVILIPLYFVSISSIKNIVHVNNPLAPLIQTKNQTRYTGEHTELPMHSSKESQNKDWTQSAYYKLQSIGLFNFLHVLAITVLFIQLIGKSEHRKEIQLWIILLLSLSLIWTLLLGSSPQPLRFYWGNLILITFVIIFSLYKLLKNSSNFDLISKTLSYSAFLLVMCFVFQKKGHYLKDFSNYMKMDNSMSWYDNVGKAHYAISSEIIDSEVRLNEIYYHKPLALGLLSFGKYSQIPTDEYIHKTYSGKPDSFYKYILCKRKDWIKFDDFRQIKFERGDYILLER